MVEKQAILLIENGRGLGRSGARLGLENARYLAGKDHDVGDPLIARVHDQLLIRHLLATDGSVLTAG